MTQSDLIQQIVRIALFIFTPLVLKLGIDNGDAATIVTAAATLIGTVGWWAYWHYTAKPAPKP
jgi:hypothetical protein